MKVDFPLRAAVVGCGRIGAGFSSPECGAILSHVSAYAASPLTELVAVCDTEAETARAAALRWGIPGSHRDVTELLEAAQPQLVSVCTPDATHAAIASRVISFPSVRGVLAEKPLATTALEAQRIETLARQRGVALAVNYSRRWAEGIRDMVPVLRGGQLGAVQTATGHYANGWLHNGTHWIDLARMLVGEVVAVRTLRAQPAPDPDDPSLAVELEFACGATGVVLGHPGEGLSLFEMDLICEKGRVRLSDGADAICVDELRPSQTFAGFLQHARLSSIRGGLAKALLNAVEDVANRINDGGAPACTGADGVVALQIAESARQSDGTWMRIEVRPS
ncbi:MAG TPA: Gfo/Idh/MocA family oxidoreductase [Rhodothermales bacterium]|nr:Gfo/Idh/MocA family oxidoreductase [Rhodothermales bacterium]